MCCLAATGPVPWWCEERNVWLTTPSVEPDVLWFCCVNQLASVYWPPKMFVTTVSIMVLVGLGPPTPANTSGDPVCAGTLLQPGRRRVSWLLSCAIGERLNVSMNFVMQAQSGSIRQLEVKPPRYVEVDVSTASFCPR